MTVFEYVVVLVSPILSLKIAVALNLPSAPWPLATQARLARQTVERGSLHCSPASQPRVAPDSRPGACPSRLEV